MVDRRQQLEQLDKATLIEHCLLLEKRVEMVERQMSELKRALGVGVVKTPQNSSLPPSQGRKANRKAKRRAKRGPKKGHIGVSRRRQLPDEIIECRVGGVGAAARICLACRNMWRDGIRWWTFRPFVRGCVK